MIDFSTIANSSNAADTQSTGARSKLTENFDTFLTLLTAQLANQDPLDPVDSAQFTQQLVQYSQVEQQILTNERLAGLTDTFTQQIQATSAGAALAFMGQTAEFDSPVLGYSGEGDAEWRYVIGANAESVKLVVKDAKGKTVFETEGSRGAGVHEFVWDGKTAQGDQAPEGIYKLEITAKDDAGEKIDAAASVREKISGVDLSSGAATVVTPGGMRPFDTIMRILERATS